MRDYPPSISEFQTHKIFVGIVKSHWKENEVYDYLQSLDKKFTKEQANEIYIGFKQGLTVEQVQNYASSGISQETMERARLEHVTGPFMPPLTQEQVAEVFHNTDKLYEYGFNRAQVAALQCFITDWNFKDRTRNFQAIARPSIPACQMNEVYRYMEHNAYDTRIENGMKWANVSPEHFHWERELWENELARVTNNIYPNIENDEPIDPGD